MNPNAATPIQAQFVKAMAAHGWRPDPVRLDVASKDYETAAGGRTAVVYCRQNSDGAHVLTGGYWSEGRNALSTCWAMFWPGTDEATLDSEIERFTTEVEKAIRQTYAMRIQALLAEPDGEEGSTSPASAPRG